MRGVAAAWPVMVALVAALDADAALTAFLGGLKTYNGQAPEGTRGYYIVVADDPEDQAPTFGAPGNMGAVRFDVWSPDMDYEAVNTIYGHLVRVLHMVPLALPAGSVGPRTWLSGKMRKVLSLPDPPSGGTHLVAEYAYRTREAA